MAAEKRISPPIALLLSLTLCYFVSFVGWLAAERGLGFWYVTLQKPPFTPPVGVFAPVWTVLYALMGVAAHQVWGSEDASPKAKRLALIAHLIQLALNALWSWLFFGFQRLDLALYEVVALWASIAWVTLLFFRIRPSAGWMLVPYLAWVTFASLLNFSLYQLNH